MNKPNSKFFKQKKQTQMRTIPKICHHCKEPLPKATIHNSIWQAGTHTGYVCDKPECHEGLAKSIDY